MEKFTRWLPGGSTTKLTKEEKVWLENHPGWEIKWTAFYRCGFLNYLEIERFNKLYKIVDVVLTKKELIN